MSREDVSLLSRETGYRGYFQVDRLRLRHGLFAGGTGPELIRELFVCGDSTCCLPYDPIRDEVVLIEQFRMAPYAAGDTDRWLVETAAGMNDGETPEEVARREVLEETGCTVTDLVHVTDLFPCPGSCSSRASLYVGRTDTGTVGGVHGLDSEAEDIRVFTVPLPEALKMVDDNRIRVLDAATILLWLARHGGALRRSWS